MQFARAPVGALTVGLDTIPGSTGRPPPGSGDRHADAALALNLTRRTGQAWVRDRLDPDRVDYGQIPEAARPASQDGWRPLELVTDKPWLLPLTRRHTPMRFNNVGLLRYGYWSPARPSYNNLALWHVDGSALRLRIPWAMAGISDPSSHQALIPQRLYRATSVTIPGIGITVSTGDRQVRNTGTVRWNNWQGVRYRERIKAGAAAVRAAFSAISGGFRRN
jgi:hypothetical protein